MKLCPGTSILTSLLHGNPLALSAKETSRTKFFPQDREHQLLSPSKALLCQNVGCSACAVLRPAPSHTARPVEVPVPTGTLEMAHSVVATRLRCLCHLDIISSPCIPRLIHPEVRPWRHMWRPSSRRCHVESTPIHRLPQAYCRPEHTGLLVHWLVLGPLWCL